MNRKAYLEQLDSLIHRVNSKELTDSEGLQILFGIVEAFFKEQEQFLEKTTRKIDEFDREIGDLQAVEIAQILALSFIAEKGMTIEFDAFMAKEITDALSNTNTLPLN
ncbi:hypothetical protein KIH86_03510 [Paenibacillus sp. HN-1]|uniref:hypothetical protein n=1 Tax=Paenibacillus TaxID=44249 RepID=UPI001CA9B8DF|nr:MULTISPECIES: hypothetical protein [Paenibacillus]MBY9077249.1 hypothetical protein [Paenibacillus sp. CGMCC 1.18879]MBY9083296.1 hypothetical protein [Paenibacillus sinensis]